MAENLLEVEDLHVGIGQLPILSGVWLAVAPGQAVGLVGETGCGKTMTVRAVTGLLRWVGGAVTKGRVRLAGDDVAHASDRVWRSHQGSTLALVPQSSMSSLDPLMRVRAQLVEAIRRRQGATDVDAEVRSSLEAMQLEPTSQLLRSYPHELSGGMRQRVMIALALATRPRLLVADEPTTALDASNRRSVLDLLANLRRSQGLGLLLISHDIGAISAATDDVVVMYGGRSVESGPTGAVLAAPAHPYTRALLGALPERSEPGALLPVISGQPPEAGTVPSGCPFRARCPDTRAACAAAAPSRPCGPGRTVACLGGPELAGARVGAPVGAGVAAGGGVRTPAAAGAGSWA
jgi:oligopeptide/dipeptide ABC transporter ATP-binding protein